MLLRLIPLSGTIEFCLPEPFKPNRREAGYTKLRRWRCVRETEKPVPSTCNLRIPVGNCILFPVSGAQVKFFREKTPPEEAVVMLDSEVGALFRDKSLQPAKKQKSNEETLDTGGGEKAKDGTRV